MGPQPPCAKAPVHRLSPWARRRTWLLILLVGFSQACATTDPASAPPLHLDLTTDKERYHAFEPVRISMALTNLSGEPVHLTFPTTQRFDVVIRSERGSPIWRWSDGRRFSRTSGEHVLEGGGDLGWEVTFEGRLSPGTYRVEGIGAGSPAPGPAAATFQVK